VVRRACRVLEELGLLRRERDFDAAPKAPHRFSIVDNAVQFWFRFVQPARSRLASGEPRTVWNDSVRPGLDGHMQQVFWHMAREAFGLHHGTWGYPAAVQWARWHGTDANRRR